MSKLLHRIKLLSFFILPTQPRITATKRSLSLNQTVYHVVKGDCINQLASTINLVINKVFQLI